MIYIISGDDEKVISNWLFEHKNIPCVTFIDRNFKYTLEEIKNICKEVKNSNKDIIIKTFNSNITLAFHHIAIDNNIEIKFLFANNGTITEINKKEGLEKLYGNLIEPTDILFLGDDIILDK
ncbi:MAG: hypothetical protein NC222_06970 [Staphylococcus sp.]|nr:hypothetical protein [Staphylococcus sp.]